MRTSSAQFFRIIFLLVAILSVFSGLLRAETGTFDRSGQTIQIWRDGAGVPHVVAKSMGDAYWGFGYCLGHDRLLQVELLRRSVQGTLAELFGPAFVDVDFQARRDAIPRAELEDGWRHASEPFAAALKSFTGGLNAAVQAAREKRMAVDPGFRTLGIQPRPFLEIEVLELFAGTMAGRYNDFTQELDNLRLLTAMVKKHGARGASQIFDDVIPFYDPGVYTTLGKMGHYLPALPGGPTREPLLTPAPGEESPTLRRQKRNQLLKSLGIPEKSGSYAAALSLLSQGKKEALLYGGPQMGYFKPSALYEIGLHTPDFDLVGTTPVGYFVILFGANRHLGFTATAGVANQVDLIALTRVASDPTQLKGDWGAVPLKQEETRIVVKGEKKPLSRNLEFTPIGPILASEKETVFLKRRGWQGRVVDSYDGWFLSNHAPDLDTWFQDSDRMALSINWLGADRQGNIGYVYCGLGKSRKSFGDDRLPSRRPPLFPFPDMRLAGVNPASGFFANWNSPPIDGFRDGDMQNGWSSDQRTKFLAEQIAGNRNEWSIDFLRRLDAKIAFTDLRAWYFKDELLRMMDADRLQPRLQEAFHALSNWDNRRTDTDGDGVYDSIAPSLFEGFWNRVFGAVFGEALGEFAWLVGSDPTWTQSALLLRALKGQSSFDYLHGRKTQEIVTDALASAVADLASPGMPLKPLPCPSMEFAGVNHVGAPSQAAPATFSPYMNRGSDVQMLRLTPEGVQIWGILPPGETDRGIHSADQVEAFRNFAWRERPLFLRDVRNWARSLEVVKLP